MSDSFDNSIYEIVEKVIEKNYAVKTTEQRECYINTIKNDEIVKKFYTKDLQYKPNDLWGELKPYMEKIVNHCDSSPISASFLRIEIVATLVVIMGLVLAVFIFYRIRKKRIAKDNVNKSQIRAKFITEC